MTTLTIPKINMHKYNIFNKKYNPLEHSKYLHQHMLFKKIGLTYSSLKKWKKKNKRKKKNITLIYH